jgi:ElaB/YqjD/DUF883 family membrane-anchored ribosome-binding protein
MLSAKAKAAAKKIEALNEEDVQSISEMIRHEVEHATHVVAERAKEAEAKVRDFADHASDDVKRYSSQAKQKIEDNPLPSVAIALGVGFILGALLIRGNHR